MSPIGLSITDWADLGTAAFTAATAAIALAAIRQGARAWKLSVEPELHVQVVYQPAPSLNRVFIHNAGGGIAKASMIYVVVDGVFSTGTLGDGFVAPGDKIVVTPTPAVPGIRNNIEVMVFYRTRDESLYSVDRANNVRRLRRGRGGRRHTPHTLQWWWDDANPGLHWPDKSFPIHVAWLERRGVEVGADT